MLILFYWIGALREKKILQWSLFLSLFCLHILGCSALTTSQELGALSHFLPSNPSFCYLHVCLWKSPFLSSECPQFSALAQPLWLVGTYSPKFLLLCPRGDAQRPERTTKVQFGFKVTVTLQNWNYKGSRGKNDMLLKCVYNTHYGEILFWLAFQPGIFYDFALLLFS